MFVHRLLSFFYPITRKVQSQHSGVLEIVYSKGKKTLYSAHANYSYGALQRVLKFGLDQLNLDRVERVLVLGLGGGSVIETLRNDFSFTGKITAVDVDPVIIQLADLEFGIRPNEQTTIVCDDAFHFVKTNSQDYELIIVDLFLDDQIPVQFLHLDFWELLILRLSPRAELIFNTIDGQSAALDKIKLLLQQHGLGVREYQSVEQTNTILIARTSGRTGLSY
jgi:spermidine synthase